jgi:hypothetical protein
LPVEAIDFFKKYVYIQLCLVSTYSYLWGIIYWGGINRHYLRDPNTQSEISVEKVTPAIVDASGRELLFRTEDYIKINRIFTAKEIEKILGFPHPLFCDYTNNIVSNKSRGVVIHISDENKLEGQANLELLDLYFIWSEFDNDGNQTVQWTGGTESHWG